MFRDGRALVARRARPPLLGLYSLPGGVVEIGERLEAAALRELAEEVGVVAEILGFNRHVESIERDARGVRWHYVIASFVARWIAGEPRASEEAEAPLWIDPRAMSGVPTTPGLEETLEGAVRLFEAAR